MHQAAIKRRLRKTSVNPVGPRLPWIVVGVGAIVLAATGAVILRRRVATWAGNTRVRRFNRINEYLIDGSLQSELIAVAEPGDVLLTRKTWYVSNLGLPGFWTHGLLYIGDPETFAAYFDDPDVRTWVREVSGEDIDLPSYLERRYPASWLLYQNGLRGKPYRVIEAISDGVSFSTLEHAAGDYLVDLRPRLEKKAKAQAIVETFSYIGIPYDFDFDFATDNALVCTELIWQVYLPESGKAGLRLEMSEIAGYPILTANDLAKQYVAQRGAEGAQFDFVMFIDGVENQQYAIVSDEKTFLETPERIAWDMWG